MMVDLCEATLIRLPNATPSSLPVLSLTNSVTPSIGPSNPPMSPTLSVSKLPQKLSTPRSLPRGPSRSVPYQQIIHELSISILSLVGSLTRSPVALSVLGSRKSLLELIVRRFCFIQPDQNRISIVPCIRCFIALSRDRSVLEFGKMFGVPMYLLQFILLDHSSESGPLQSFSSKHAFNYF